MVGWYRIVLFWRVKERSSCAVPVCKLFTGLSLTWWSSVVMVHFH